MTDHELESMLWAVPKATDDYVNGIIGDIREFGIEEGVVSYIEDNPNASIGYVAEHATRLAGLLASRALMV